MPDPTSDPLATLGDVTTSAETPALVDDALLRLQADFINYKRRTEGLAKASADQALGALVRELLVVLDSLDLAESHVALGSEFDPVHRLLRDTLRTAGLETLDPLGDAFDPALHDALEISEAPSLLLVTQVLRRGYRWRGQLLRPALVILGA